MKKIFFMFTLVLFSVFCLSTVSYPFDGTWWKKQDATQKRFYVMGFADGISLGYQWLWRNLADSKCKNMIEESYRSFDMEYKLPMQNPQIIVDQLDIFYSYGDNRNVDVMSGIWIVLLKLHGDSDEKIIEMLKSSRKRGDSRKRIEDKYKRKRK